MIKQICPVLFCLLFGFYTPLLAQSTILNGSWKLDSIPKIDSLSDRVIMIFARGLSTHAKIMFDTFTAHAQEASAKRAVLETELAAAKLDSTLTKEYLNILVSKVKSAKSNEKALQKQQTQAEKTASLAERTANMDSLLQRKNLRKSWLEVLKTDKTLHPPPPPVEKPVAEILPIPVALAIQDTASITRDSIEVLAAVSEKPAKTKTSEKPSAKYKPYDPARDVMLHPPQIPCNLALNTKDEFSGEVRKETTRAELFRYTNPVLKNYLKGKTHIICETSIGTAGPLNTLNFIYTIRDPNARKAFGGVQKNSVAILKFMDGTTFSVYNVRADEGVFDPSGEIITYRAQYGIDKAILKKLRNTELDKIRMAWSTGYEDYDVQQVDLFIHLVPCIE